MCHKLLINLLYFGILRALLNLLFKGKFVHKIIGILNLSLYLCSKVNFQVTIYVLADFPV